MGNIGSAGSCNFIVCLNCVLPDENSVASGRTVLASPLIDAADALSTRFDLNPNASRRTDSNIAPLGDNRFRFL